MKSKIKQVVKQSALALVFENVQKIPMIEITIAAKGKQPDYSVKVPKAFLEEVYAIGVRDGFEMYIESGAIRQTTRVKQYEKHNQTYSSVVRTTPRI